MASGTEVINTELEVIEGAGLPLALEITDDGNADASVTPDSISWSLYDNNNVIVNARTNIVITPAATMYIVPTGDDNVITGGLDERRVLIKAVADLEAGNNLVQHWMLIYKIVDAP